ncbi:MAG: hypothetical protein QXL33_03245 [Sulfolobaceae archaeon]
MDKTSLIGKIIDKGKSNRSADIKYSFAIFNNLLNFIVSANLFKPRYKERIWPITPKIPIIIIIGNEIVKPSKIFI